MRTEGLIIIVVIFISAAEACDLNQQCDINTDDGNIQAMRQAMETFSLTMMNVMYSDTTLEGNVTFSPANVYVTLFSLMVAAADNAKNELIAALGLADTDLAVMQEALIAIVNGLQVLNTANIRSQEIAVENLSLGEALYVQSGLNVIDSFTKLLHALDADSYATDFSRAADWATRKINQWIYNQTGKRTPITLTRALDPDAKLMTATATFFSAKWPDNFFDPAHNGLGTFTSATGQTNVMMMGTFKKLLFYDDKQTFAAIQLPFQNPSFVLTIVLPYGSANPADFVKSFNADHLKMIVEQSTEVDITVKIPKLAIAWTGEISEQLAALKVKQIFQASNFPGMIEYAEGQLGVSAFTQSAGLVINEVGVSMADITPVSTTQPQLGGPNNPPAFIMDRPCLFLVRHVRSGLIVHTSFVRQI